jgi:rod shape-determining protein MreC
MIYILRQRKNIVFLFYIIFCSLLMNLSYYHPEKFSQPRNFAVQALKPILSVASMPASWLSNASQNTTLYFNTVEQNKYLKQENEVLQQWYRKSLSLEAENERLRTLLGQVANSRESSPLLVQPFTDANSPFARSLLINAGASQGIQKGQEVVNHEGLVGRIIHVFEDHARVLLITDHTFRLPARILEHRTRALVKGTNGPQLEIMLVENARAKMHSGMTVVTSGMDGAFMADIPVGSVKKSGNDFIVIPDVDFSKLEHLIVHRHKVGDILPDEADADD